MIGENIRKCRKKKKMTQEELAKAMGVSQGLVSSWEREAVQLTLPTIKEIANVLGVTFSDLVGDDETLALKEPPWGTMQPERPLPFDGQPYDPRPEDKPETEAIRRKILQKLDALAEIYDQAYTDVDGFVDFLLHKNGKA